MAYEKQDWKDALQASKPEGSGSDDNTDQRAQKKQARLMYAKRALYKEIKSLFNNKVVKYKEIVGIHRKHGIYIT